MLDTKADLAALQSLIQSMDPAIETEIDSFSSDAIDFAVRLGSKFFLMRFFPSSDGFSVDQILNHEALETGYKSWFPDFDSAKSELITMVNNALTNREE